MIKFPNRLEDAGNVRRFTARWVIMGELILKTAAHLGGGEGETVDMVVLKDARDGLPFIPGTSLAGALRSHLADILGGYFSKEDPKVSQLFGGSRGDDKGEQSPLIVFDAFGLVPDGLNIEIRDGVSLDPGYGVADPHKKFDFEVLPAGTSFDIRFDLLITEGQNEKNLLSLLATALRGLEEGEISIGKRRSRGLGKIKVHNWRVRRFDLSKREGWLDWALSDHEDPVGEPKSFECLRKAISTSFPEISLENFEDRRCRLIAKLDLEVVDDLLVRSPGLEPRAPDAVHLQSAGRPVLPGTSLAGALRQHALRIACLIHGEEKGKAIVDALFGPRKEGALCASRLRISESFIENGSFSPRWRIAIDRFTGGVISGALFDELVHRRGCLYVRMELRNRSDDEKTEEIEGLLLLLIRDLLAGEIPVGGAVSIGRGILSGTAKVTFSENQTVHIRHDLSDEESFELIVRKIKAFQEEKMP